MNKLKQFVMEYKGVPAYLALCVTVANAVLFCTANFTIELGFSIWGVAILLMVVTAIILMIRFMQVVFRTPVFYALLVYAAWLAVSVIRGCQAGNSMANILEDIGSVLYFVLFPVVLCILNTEERIITLMKLVMYCGFAVGVASVVFLASYVFWPVLFDELLHWSYYGQIINFTRISETIPRILFVSSPMQLFSCAFAVYFMVNDRKNILRYSVMVGVILFSVLITFTRSLYLATFAAAVALVVLLFANTDRKTQCFVIKGIGIVVAVCAVLVLVFSLGAKTNYFGYALQRVFVNVSQTETVPEEPTVEVQTEPSAGTAATEEPTQTTVEVITEATQHSEPTEETMIEFHDEETYLQATAISDNMREKTKGKLMEIIRQNPIWGAGYGIRIEGRRTVPEFFFLDMWAKTGVVGVVLFLLPLMLVAAVVLKQTVSRQADLVRVAWLTGLLGMTVYSVFQPYMNNAPCILMYCCVLSVDRWQQINCLEKKE